MIIFFPMRICVGSTNQTKVQAVINAVQDSTAVKNAEVQGLDVVTEVSGHPINSLEAPLP